MLKYINLEGIINGILITFVIAGLTALYGFIKKVLAKNAKRNEERFALLEKGQEQMKANDVLALKARLIIMQHNLAQAHREHKNAGYITLFSLRILEDEYKIYKELGGNGIAETIMKEIRGLPIKDTDGGV